MDENALIEAANESIAGAGGASLRKTGDAERYSTTEVWAEYEGHPVRITFTETDSSPREYRYNAAVYDSETGDLIATGNGGGDWQDAFSIVQWQKLTNHWA